MFEQGRLPRQEGPLRAMRAQSARWEESQQMRRPQMDIARVIIGGALDAEKGPESSAIPSLDHAAAPPRIARHGSIHTGRHRHAVPPIILAQ